MNLILDNSEYVRYYTHLDDVFLRIPELRQYHWLISNLEANYLFTDRGNGQSDERLRGDVVLIDGETLNEILQSNDVQFIWGVFSAFRQPVQTLPEELPWADGGDFWIGSPQPQAMGAEMEIVAWDSSCTLFINVPPGMAKTLREMYPDIQDLDEMNRKRSELAAKNGSEEE
ncbi:MAG: hypothetical protein ACYS8X_11085 [Planctomycetota bacterium]|jgi:hypothetical protein